MSTILIPLPSMSNSRQVGWTLLLHHIQRQSTALGLHLPYNHCNPGHHHTSLLQRPWNQFLCFLLCPRRIHSQNSQQDKLDQIRSSAYHCPLVLISNETQAPYSGFQVPTHTTLHPSSLSSDHTSPLPTPLICQDPSSVGVLSACSSFPLNLHITAFRSSGCQIPPP